MAVMAMAAMGITVMDTVADMGMDTALPSLSRPLRSTVILQSAATAAGYAPVTDMVADTDMVDQESA